MRAVDVRHEVRAQAVLPVRPQRLGHHHRTEVGAADADVDHVGDRLAGRALPRARAEPVGEPAHLREHRVDLRHHVDAVDEDRPVAAVAQRGVEHGPVLGAVDLVAGEHPVAPAGDVGLLGEREQELHGLGGRAVLGVVDEDAARLARHRGESLWIAREQVAQVRRRDRALVRGQRLPGW